MSRSKLKRFNDLESSGVRIFSADFSMSRKSILMSLTAVLFMALMVLGVVFWTKQKASQEEAKIKKEAKTIEEVRRNLTAPAYGELKENKVSSEVMESLSVSESGKKSSVKTKESMASKEVIDSLTAPK